MGHINHIQQESTMYLWDGWRFSHLILGPVSTSGHFIWSLGASIQRNIYAEVCGWSEGKVWWTASPDFTQNKEHERIKNHKDL